MVGSINRGMKVWIIMCVLVWSLALNAGTWGDVLFNGYCSDIRSYIYIYPLDVRWRIEMMILKHFHKLPMATKTIRQSANACTQWEKEKWPGNKTFSIKYNIKNVIANEISSFCECFISVCLQCQARVEFREKKKQHFSSGEVLVYHFLFELCICGLMKMMWILSVCGCIDINTSLIQLWW